jgi:glycosyltransferase involved in cell wall biosynthesis
MHLNEYRLLVITNRYPHIKDSMSSSFVKNQVDCLKNYFEKVCVISLAPFIPKFLSTFSFMKPRWKRDAFASDYKYDNVEVYFAKHFTLPFNSSRKKRGNAVFKTVNKIIEKKRIEFDIIHAHFTYPSGYVGAKLKENYGKTLIITGHGRDVYDLPFKNAEWHEKIRSVLNVADHILTPSKSNYDKLVQLDISEEKVTAIYNGYDPNLFKSISMNKAKEKLNLPEDKKIILSVGNLEMIKGHKYLIEAIKEVAKREKNIICLVVGSGNQKKYLDGLINRLHLNDYIKLVGGKSHTEIPLWMNACDVFVLPSLNEGNPTVMFEALGCGKPFIGTNVGGIPEIITNEKLGIIVKPKDVDELANAILKALDKEWDKDYISNYAKQYSWDKIAVKIIGVYNEVLEEK